MEEISQRLARDKNTVTKAKVFAYKSRGLPVPDGRTRRKGLDRGISRPYRRRGSSPSDEESGQ